MKILVLGAGAVGGYFGGRMAEAGMNTAFQVRPARAELMAKNGLRIQSKAGDARLAVKCVTEGNAGSDYDVIMFTAKAYDLDNAMNAIAPAMAGRALVWPLLNGMSHLDALDARFGRARVLGGVAYISSTLAPDGVIRHFSEFQRVVFGPRDMKENPAQKAVCDALSAALGKVKFEWKQLDNVAQAMWDKWVMLASLAGMTCLMRAPVGDIMATNSGEKLTLALLGECSSIAKAAGFPTPDNLMNTYRGMLTAKGSPATASMLRDVESGGAAEGDHILGDLLARAGKLSVATPVLEVAVTNLEAYAARRKRGKAN